jgi:transcriptional regulator with XRE-family HTH domain
MSKIGARLTDFREERRLTQQELSAQSRVPQQTISNIESGTRKNPRMVTMAKLSEALRVPLQSFYESENDVPTKDRDAMEMIRLRLKPGILEELADLVQTREGAEVVSSLLELRRLGEDRFEQALGVLKILKPNPPKSARKARLGRPRNPRVP